MKGVTDGVMAITAASCALKCLGILNDRVKCRVVQNRKPGLMGHC